MKAHCLLLVFALLMPSASFALVTVYGEVWITWKNNPADEDFELAGRDVLVQLICDEGRHQPNVYTDDEGLFRFRTPSGSCQLRVVLPDNEIVSTVASVYFADVEEADLVLFVEPRGSVWYLDAYAE